MAKDKKGKIQTTEKGNQRNKTSKMTNRFA